MKWTRMSVFDLDRTLVLGNCSFSFCFYLISQGVLPRSSLFYAFLYYLKHSFFGMPLGELHQKIFRHTLKGRSLEALERQVEDFAISYLAKKSNEKVLSRLRLAQHLGEYTLLLSNSPNFLVSRFAKLLGMDGWQSTQYGVDREKNLFAITSILQGQDKAAYVEQLSERLSIAKKDVTAYSDSYLDLPFLLTAGTPIVVNPDRKLRKFSQSHQWTII